MPFLLKCATRVMAAQRASLATILTCASIDRLAPHSPADNGVAGSMPANQLLELIRSCPLFPPLTFRRHEMVAVRIEGLSKKGEGGCYGITPRRRPDRWPAYAEADRHFRVTERKLAARPSNIRSGPAKSWLTIDASVLPKPPASSDRSRSRGSIRTARRRALSIVHRFPTSGTANR